MKITFSRFQYQLGLPIRVEFGLIGNISLKIPWAGLFSQPIILCVEVTLIKG